MEDLGRAGAPGCDLAGSSLSLPDGMGTVTIPGAGEVFSQQTAGTGAPQLLVVNWGVPGVGVATIGGGRLVDLWASTEEAADLQRQQLSVEGIEHDG